MGLLDATTDHAIKAFDDALKARIDQIDKMLDEKIDRAQKIVNGLRVTNTTAFDTPEVKKAEPIT